MAELRSSVTLTPPVGPDPLECDEFAYGLGDPGGIMMLRYLSGGALSFGACRQDFLHQMYWSPEGVLAGTRNGRTWHIGGHEALWARRAVSHDVRAYGREHVYRICVRRTPPALVGLDYGVVQLSEDAVQALRLLSSPGLSTEAALEARARMFDGVQPATSVPDQVGGLGHAAAVARYLAYDPADQATLSDWARHLHVSTKTLQRDFERTYGVSFSVWRTERRLALARTLLESEPVSRVAALVGYHSSSAFIAAFRRQHGCTPAQSASQFVA